MRMCEIEPQGPAQADQVRLHVEGHLGHRLGVVGARLGQARHDHVGVADGLDLLQAVTLREVIERAEDLVQDAHDAFRVACAQRTA